MIPEMIESQRGQFDCELRDRENLSTHLYGSASRRGNSAPDIE